MQTTDFPEPDLGLDDVRLHTLAGDIRDAMLTRFRHTRKTWPQMSEQEQSETGHAFDQAARDMVRAVVRTLTGYDFPRVVVRIGDVQFKGGEKPVIVGKITADNTKDYRDIMGDAPGSQAVLLFVDSEAFLNARGPVATDPDEPDLPFAGDGDEDEIKIEGGSALAISTAVAAAFKDRPAKGEAGWDEDEIAAIVIAACNLAPDAAPEAVATAVRSYADGTDTSDAPSEEELAAMIRRNDLLAFAKAIVGAYEPDGEAFTDGEVRQMAEAEIGGSTLDPAPSIEELLDAMREVIAGGGAEITDTIAHFAAQATGEHPDGGDPRTAQPEGLLPEDGGAAMPETTPESPSEDRSEPGAMPETTPEQPVAPNPADGGQHPFEEATDAELTAQRTRQRLKAAEEGGSTEPGDNGKRTRKGKASAEA